MSSARTLGELRASSFTESRLVSRRVKDEMRENLMTRLCQHPDDPIFPGIVGYDDTVVPQIVNAILSRHNFILLGLRGQAKSRILRALTSLLDPQMPYIAGCEIHDNPYAPICRRCREEVARRGEDTAIAYLTPDERYIAITAGSNLAVLATSPLNPKPKVPGTPLPLITEIAVGARPVAVSIPGWIQ